MGRRKGRKESSETLNPKSTENDETPIPEEEEAGEGGASGKFFACYLLTSLSPRFKGHTYIGFTVNPRRRIRQHNGEIGSGAWRTKKRRPWEMVFCIYGFPTNVAALQFEWAWQHPVESLAVRKAVATFTSLSGLANKIKLAYTMLTLPSWQSLNLTVNYFSTKYMKHTAHCPRLPEHMRVQVGSLDELPCYTGSSLYVGEDDEWDTEVYCEQSMGSQESTDDASADTQKVSNFAVVQDSFKEIEHGRNQLAEESAHEQGGLMERTVLRLPKDNSTDVQDSFKEIERGRYNWAVEKSADELEGSTESTLLRQPKHLRITEEEAMEKQSSGLNDCQVITPPFSISSCTITRNAEDRGTFRLLCEFNDKYGLLLTKQSPEKVVANKDQPPSISSEVEVIDVFTPSPCYKVNAGNKKRKLSVACPEIIDLTNSPMFV